MARITDLKKVERLKESTMKLVVEHGFGGASASLIAKDAEVASGYFYMHYKGKYEMVNAILHEVFKEIVDRFTDLIENGATFTETIEKMVEYFFKVANSEPVKVKFLYVLTNDYSFVIDSQVREEALHILDQLKEMGHSSGELDKRIDEIDLYLVLFMNTVQFINQRFKSLIKNRKLDKNEQEHLLYIIFKILK